MPDATQTWKGYAIHDTKDWQNFKVIEYSPKEQGEYDIDVKIHYCGVCGSDVHTINGGWGHPMLPVIPGHEVAGTVSAVGSKVTSVKVGDRVGVGAQVSSCFNCKPCKTDNENYCPDLIDTYNIKYPNGDMAYGGYAQNIRAHERYVFPIPDALPLEQAAPMFCAGLTVFSPLKRHGAGPGKVVGIVGVGGLGHFAVQFAKALGSEKVVVFSHSERKKNDAMEMGADDFVKTEDEEHMKKYAGEVDLIICTADVGKGLALDSLLATMAVHGKFIMCGMPDDHFEIKSQLLSGNGVFIGGSHIGSRPEVLEMLELASQKGVKSWIEVLDMKDAGKAVKNVYDNNVRYRHVLKVDI